jgi:hypothetical protein
LLNAQKHFSSLSREEPAEASEWAGFLTNGSSPGILAFPVLFINEWRALKNSAGEAGFPITVAGPCGICTHFPFIPEWGTLFAFQRSIITTALQNTTDIPSCQKQKLLEKMTF